MSQKAAAAATSLDEVQRKWKTLGVLAGTIMHLLVFSLLLAAAARSGKRGENWKSSIYAVPSPSSPDSSVAAVISQNIPKQWVIPDDTALDEYFANLREDKAWPTGPVEYVELVVEDQNMLTTPKANAVKEGERCFSGPSAQSQLLRLFCSLLDPDPKESSTWKIALLGITLLVSLLGSLSLAYYMCVWRGGRIHYDLQKDVSV